MTEPETKTPDAILTTTPSAPAMILPAGVKPQHPVARALAQAQVVDLATWSDVTASLLATLGEKGEHETDPPAAFWAPRQPKPGALPSLVKFEDVAKGAKIEKRSLSMPSPSAAGLSLAHALYHMSRTAILEARRCGAKSLALKPPVVTDSLIQFPVVLVL